MTVMFTVRWTDCQKYKQKDKQTDTWIERKRYRETDRQID